MSSFNQSLKKAIGMFLAAATVLSICFQPFKGPAGANRPGIVLFSSDEQEETLPLEPDFPKRH